MRKIERTTILLVCTFFLSVVPWILAFSILTDAREQDLEGLYLITTFVGAISFVLTGPLAGVALTALSRGNGRIRGLLSFGVAFACLSAPTVSFEVFAFSSSILPDLAGYGTLPLSRIVTFYSYSAVLAAAFYAVYFGAMFYLSRRGVVAAAIGALALVVCSSAVIGIRLVHP